MENSTLPKTSAGIVWCILFSLQSLFIVFLNTATVVTFIINRHLHKRSMYLLINLSVADLLVGLISIPICVYDVGATTNVFPKFQSPTTFYYVYVFIDIFFGLSSVVTLTLIALERMRATVWPIRHHRSRSRMYVYLICAAWLMPAMIAAIQVLNLYFRNGFLPYWIPHLIIIGLLVLIIISYTLVFVNFKRKIWRNTENGRTRRDQRDRKLAVTLVIVTATSCLAWFPFFVLYLVILYSKMYVSYNTILVFKFLHYTNSSCNPVIYAIKMMEFRTAFFSLLRSCSRDKNYVPQSIILLGSMLRLRERSIPSRENQTGNHAEST